MQTETKKASQNKPKTASISDAVLINLQQLRNQFKYVRTNMLKAHPDSLAREQLLDLLVHLSVLINKLSAAIEDVSRGHKQF